MRPNYPRRYVHKDLEEEFASDMLTAARHLDSALVKLLGPDVSFSVLNLVEDYRAQ